MPVPCCPHHLAPTDTFLPPRPPSPYPAASAMAMAGAQGIRKGGGSLGGGVLIGQAEHCAGAAARPPLLPHPLRPPRTRTGNFGDNNGGDSTIGNNNANTGMRVGATCGDRGGGLPGLHWSHMAGGDHLIGCWSCAFLTWCTPINPLTAPLLPLPSRQI